MSPLEKRREKIYDRCDFKVLKSLDTIMMEVCVRLDDVIKFCPLLCPLLYLFLMFLFIFRFVYLSTQQPIQGCGADRTALLRIGLCNWCFGILPILKSPLLEFGSWSGLGGCHNSWWALCVPWFPKFPLTPYWPCISRFQSPPVRVRDRYPGTALQEARGAFLPVFVLWPSVVRNLSRGLLGSGKDSLRVSSFSGK